MSKEQDKKKVDDKLRLSRDAGSPASSDIPQSSINFIKYHPDKELDPLFERFLLWSSHILPYKQDEIIKKCEALQKIRNKFRENYTEAKNGLIDVLNKMNISLMKLLNDEQLITIFNKQLKQLSKINKIKYEPIEDYDELYKKNHELYDNLPDYQKERFLFSNLNKNILKYFGLYKSFKERKINNLIDDRLREYNIIKEKDLKRKKEEQEKEDKVIQEIKKQKSEQPQGQSISIDNPLKNSYFISLRDNLREAVKLEEVVKELQKIDMDKLGKRNKRWLNEFIQLLEKLPGFINAGQTNINNLDTDTLKKMAKRLPLLINHIETMRKEKLNKPVEPPKEEVKPTGELVKVAEPPKVVKEVKEDDAHSASRDFDKSKSDDKRSLSRDFDKSKSSEKKEDYPPIESYPTTNQIKALLTVDQIKQSLTKEDEKLFYTTKGKGKKQISTKLTKPIKDRIKTKYGYHLSDNDIKGIFEYFKSNKNNLPTKENYLSERIEQIKSQEDQQINPPEVGITPSGTRGVPEDEQIKELEERFNKLTLEPTIKERQKNTPPEQLKEELIQEKEQLDKKIQEQKTQEDIPGYGLLGTIIKGIGSIFGLGGNVLSDEIVKELLKYQNQKDGNKIIDSIIIWELMHRHKNINKSKYPEIIKEFDKKHRPKLFYVRSKFKKYNNTDKFLGGFPIGLLAGLIPSALQGVSSIISAIKGNGCGSWSAGTPSSLDKVKGSLKKTKTNNLKGGKSMTLQDLNNIKQNIKN